LSSVVEALRDLAARVPEQIVLAAPDCAVSAAGLLARAQRLAGQLQQARAGVVGLLCDNSIDWAVADLACQYAGLCMVPIPVFFSAAQMRHVLGIGRHPSL
jgi:acyl-CoA synthetase (AMP-forming)/AMP-acid ligase II